MPLRNPLTETFAVLRPSLLPGLVDAVAYNLRRESADVRLFEVGAVFSPAGERTRAGWVMTGARESHWSSRAGSIDFSDVKGVAELVAGASGAPLEISRADDLPWFTPGRSARLELGHRPGGWIGEIAPAVLQARGLPSGTTVYGGEIDLEALAAVIGGTRPIDPLPRHPSIVRDLSLVIDQRLPAADVRGTIRAHAPVTLVSVREFDRYQGKGVPEGQISLSVRLTFRAPDRTLTDIEVQRAIETIVAALTREHQATLRGTTGGHQE